MCLVVFYLNSCQEFFLNTWRTVVLSGFVSKMYKLLYFCIFVFKGSLNACDE